MIIEYNLHYWPSTKGPFFAINVTKIWQILTLISYNSQKFIDLVIQCLYDSNMFGQLSFGNISCRLQYAYSRSEVKRSRSRVWHIEVTHVTHFFRPLTLNMHIVVGKKYFQMIVDQTCYCHINIELLNQ